MRRLMLAGCIALLSTVPARAQLLPPWFAGPDPMETSFWVGGQMPDPIAAQLHGALTTPIGDTPAILDQIMYGFVTWDNRNGQSGVLRNIDDKTWKGYTLLSALGGAWKDPADGVRKQTILIDMNGAVVKAWPMRTMPAKMLPGGDVIAGIGNGKPGHVEITRLVQMDWCGNEVWSWNGLPENDVPDGGGARWHHDFEREGSPTGYYAPRQEAKQSGKTLLLVHENPDQALTANVSDTALEEDAFYEIGANGKVMWSWRPWEHVDQLGFDEVARYAIKTKVVSDPGFVGGGATETDWQHVNSLSWVGPNKWYEMGDLRFHPDNVIWDGRSSNEIAIVARHDHPKGLWKEGDVVWRLGPDYGTGTQDHRVGQIIGQHHAHIIPAGLPGAGNLLVFDNGGLAGFGTLYPGMAKDFVWWPNKYRSYSRVLEINPITYQIVWQYEQPADSPDARKFFSWFISSAQRLVNGNTLITEGANGRVFEVTRDGKIVWEYISPFGGYGMLRNATYRAYRIPESWLPANRTCP